MAIASLVGSIIESSTMNILGIFAKQPIAGDVKTRLGKQIGLEASAELYECFLRDQLTRLQAVGEQQVIGFAPNSESARLWFGQFPGYEIWPQPEGSLGQRMQRYFAEHVSVDSSVVLIGSDSPTLPISYLEDAFERLKTSDCVIGPASDGGYYLIGMTINAVEAGMFQNIAWSTATVFKQTIARAAAAKLRVATLPVWYDVDSVDALHLLSGHLASARLSSRDEQFAASELPRTSQWLKDNGY
jgi:uncharacterized protein